MKKILCLLLSLLMVISLFCSCEKTNSGNKPEETVEKTYEEKKAEAFAKAVEKNDQTAMNEYVREYFEWSDILSAEEVIFNDAGAYILIEGMRTFESVYALHTDAGRDCMVVKVTATSDFVQDSWKDHIYGDVYEERLRMGPICVVNEIFYDSSNGSYLKVNDLIPICPGADNIGIDAKGNYIFRNYPNISLSLLLPEHEYIGMLFFDENSDMSRVKRGFFYAIDAEKEYEELQIYKDKIGAKIVSSLYELRDAKFRQDMLEFFGIADKFPLPEKHPYSLCVNDTPNQDNKITAKMSDIIEALGGTEPKPGYYLSSKGDRKYIVYYWELALGTYAVTRNYAVGDVEMKDDDSLVDVVIHTREGFENQYFTDDVEP